MKCKQEGSNERKRISSKELEEILQNPHAFVSDGIAEHVIGIPVATLRRWRHEGRGPRYVKGGSSVRYKIAWLLEFLAHMTVETRDSGQPNEAA